MEIWNHLHGGQSHEERSKHCNACKDVKVTVSAGKGAATMLLEHMCM